MPISADRSPSDLPPDTSDTSGTPGTSDTSDGSAGSNPPPSDVATAAPAGAGWESADDPFVWLEQSETKRVSAWVHAQNARTLAAFAHGDAFETLVQRLVDDALSPDQLVIPTRRGDWAYDFWQDEAHPLGVWRRARWVDWLAGTAQWHALLDLDVLSEDEEVDWAWHGASVIEPAGDRALVHLSPGGGDAVVVREFDLATGDFVADGFHLETVGKHSVGWIDRDTIYLQWDPSEGDTNHPSVTRSGYPRKVRRWSRGTAPAEAPVVFACDASDLSASASYDIECGRHFAYRSVSMEDGITYRLDGDTWRAYDVPLHADVYTWKGWLMVAPRRDWDIGDTVHRGGALLAIREDAFHAGSRTFLALFTPDAKTALTGFQTGKTWAAISYSDDLVSRTRFWQPPELPTGLGSPTATPAVESELVLGSGALASGIDLGIGVARARDSAALDPDAHALREMPVVAGSETSTWFIDDLVDDAVFVLSNHYLEPPTLWRGDARADDLGALERIQQLRASFDAAEMTVIRAVAHAPDGTAIPYWVIGRRAVIESAHRTPAPCLLYGYGGFEIALEPSYATSQGMGWLEQGGVYVVANIRGGGEYGPSWHQAAMREKRPVAFDDFVSVARALIAEGFTTSAQLGIQGGSNGGLLVAACMVRHPELFGAVVCEVPVLDMQRYHRLLAGASWIDEYGDPDAPEDARFLSAYSPYHRVAAEVRYPAVLFTSAAGDDRVHPAHARKMAARMQAQGHADIWYYEETQGGHGATPDPRDGARSTALVYAFLWATIGKNGR
ncbi:prolyl oligopeptidase family serine peptidase [Pararobbsia silviterrae]|nr:prolyl oligopeptidase family serine peptidase [Pararobbsia silviterrae]